MADLTVASLLQKAYTDVNDSPVRSADHNSHSIADKISFVYEYSKAMTKEESLHVGKLFRLAGCADRLYSHPQGVQFDVTNIPNDLLNGVYDYMKQPKHG